MRLYPKKKVEIVAESACVKAILGLIEREGATGYTLFDRVSGKGRAGARDDAHVTDVFRNEHIVVVASQDIAERILEGAHEILRDYAGIVMISDVSVIRDDHF